MTATQTETYDWGAKNESGGQMSEGEHEVYISRVLLGNDDGAYAKDANGNVTMRVFFVNPIDESEASIGIALGATKFPYRSISSLILACGHNPQEMSNAGVKPGDFELTPVIDKYLGGRELRIKVAKSRDGKYINVVDYLPTQNAKKPAATPPVQQQPKPAAAPAINTAAPAPEVKTIVLIIDSIEHRPAVLVDGVASRVDSIVSAQGRFGIVNNPKLAEVAQAAQVAVETVTVHYTVTAKGNRVVNIVRSAATGDADDTM